MNYFMAENTMRLRSFFRSLYRSLDLSLSLCLSIDQNSIFIKQTIAIFAI